MKRTLIGTVAALSLSVTAAMAADIPAKAPAYSPPIVTAYNWTGFYVGINGGGAWGHSSWNGVPASMNTSGGLVGATIGYNLQSGPWVFGVEGDIDWANITGNTTLPPGTFCGPGCSTKTDWLGTVRGRVGYAVDRLLPYVTGGLALGDIKASQPGFAGASGTKAGWTVGAGLEFPVAGPWTAKAEYLYVDLGSINCAAGVCDQTANNVNHHMSVVRAGLNYRF
jgi:outer membrane immunogenic protein